MSFAYLPWYTGDYLRDTRHLTPMRHGVYLLLLAHCWDQKGPVPLDEQEASGIANCRSVDEVEALRYVLEKYFVRMDDGWYNKRMAEEVAKSERLSRVFHEAGLRSAEVRRSKSRSGYESKIEGRLKVGSAQVKGRLVSPSPSPSLSLTPSLEKDDHPTDGCEPGGSPAAEEGYKIPDCPYKKLVDLYHETLPASRRVEVLSDQRKRHIQARWRQVCADEKLDLAAGVDWFRWFFEYAGKSKFLTGKARPREGKKPFTVSLDFLMDAERFVKVYEGTYHAEA